MTPTEWSALKRGLNASADFTRQVVIKDGVRTLTYTHTSGSALVLREPTRTGAVLAERLRVGGCGFLQLCVYLNRTDQGAVAAGGAVALAVAICAIPAVGWAACAAVSGALATAAYYIGAHGFCRNELRVRLLPVSGSPRCV